MQHHEVVVLGGGPAGAAAAIALARAGLGVVVLLRPGNGAPDRCETLPPEIRLPLTELGLWERFQASGPVRSPGFVSAWGGPDLVAADSLFNPYGPGWHVDRGRFDAMLVEAADSAGATIRRDAVLTRVAAAPCGRCTLEAVCEGRRVVWHASFLIDATGRSASPARRLAGRRIVLDRLVGLAATIIPDDSVPTAIRDRRALVEATADGWWYSAPYPGGGRMAATFFTDADLVPRGPGALVRHWWAMLRQAPFTAERCGRGGRLDLLRMVAANTTRASRFAGRGWVATGDAAATLDPLCGQGVFLALESASRVAAAVDAFLRGTLEELADYSWQAEEGFAAYLRERTAYYIAERRWTDCPFWQRRQASNWGG